MIKLNLQPISLPWKLRGGVESLSGDHPQTRNHLITMNLVRDTLVTVNLVWFKRSLTELVSELKDCGVDLWILKLTLVNVKIELNWRTSPW